jgi:hypothetical protein
MSRKAVGRPVRAVAILAAVALILGIGLPASAWADSTETSTQNVSGTTLEMPGTGTTDGCGVAVPGPAIAWDLPIVTQNNIQVVAGPPETQANSTQTATNNVDIEQMTGAMTGDATSTDCGTAITGGAMAGSLVVVHQLNVQIIAGVVPTGGVTQDASNDADIGQMTLAGSGDGAADGSGTVVKTGTAHGFTYTLVLQKNIQVYVGKGNTSPEGSAEQIAANVAGVEQSAGAITGEALGTDDSTATTGDAKAKLVEKVRQTNRQIIVE